MEILIIYLCFFVWIAFLLLFIFVMNKPRYEKLRRRDVIDCGFYSNLLQHTNNSSETINKLFNELNKK